jgi:hypothetical protein
MIDPEMIALKKLFTQSVKLLANQANTSSISSIVTIGLIGSIFVLMPYKIR